MFTFFSILIDSFKSYMLKGESFLWGLLLFSVVRFGGVRTEVETVLLSGIEKLTLI